MQDLIYDKKLLSPLHSEIVQARAMPLVQRTHSFQTRDVHPQIEDLSSFSAESCKEALDVLLAWNVESETLPPAIILKAAAGAGKTTATIIEVAKAIKNHKISGNVVHLAINHKLCEETVAAYTKQGIHAEVWAGKTNEKSCARYEVARKAQSMLLKTNELCKTKTQTCPHHDSCNFIKQRKRAGQGDLSQVIVAPVEYLRSGGLPEQMHPALVIIDESFLDIMIVSEKLKVKYFGKTTSSTSTDNTEQNKHYETLNKLRSELLVHLHDDNPIDALARTVGSYENLKNMIKQVEQLRQIELKAKSKFNPSTTAVEAENMSTGEHVEHVKVEMAMWSCIKSHVDDVLNEREPAA